MKQLKKGDRILYEREFTSGKTRLAIATVAMVKCQTALLSNGDKVTKHIHNNNYTILTK